MSEPDLLKYVSEVCNEKFIWSCIDSIPLIEDLAMLGADSVKSTAGIGNAVFVFNGDS